MGTCENDAMRKAFIGQHLFNEIQWFKTEDVDIRNNNWTIITEIVSLPLR
jgi:hypothetical protein